MSNAFQILTGFLERFEDEVEGRELSQPPEEIALQLRALAKGSLPETELPQLFSLLNQNPHWVGRLAEEVKALRSNPRSAGNRTGSL